MLSFENYLCYKLAKNFIKYFANKYIAKNISKVWMLFVKNEISFYSQPDVCTLILFLKVFLKIAVPDDGCY